MDSRLWDCKKEQEETMRLQGAIFDFQGTLLDDGGRPLPGVDRFLSLMKMEDVWIYLVCDGDTAPVRAALEEAGLWKYFRGVISAAEHGGDPLDAELYEKAVRRLRTAKLATLVLTAREELALALKQDGFPVALVGEGHSPEAMAQVDEVIQDYTVMTK